MSKAPKTGRIKGSRRWVAAWLPAGRLHGGDLFLARWICLCLVVLTAVVLMMASGVCNVLELEQIRLLCGHPFYMEAEAAQISFLGQGGIFALCALVTLYVALVMLCVRGWIGRLQVTILAVLALSLPGVLCVLWGGVLNMAAPVACVLLLWLLTTFVPLFRSGR